MDQIGAACGDGSRHLAAAQIGGTARAAGDKD
jgi:hypothetical protein